MSKKITEVHEITSQELLKTIQACIKAEFAANQISPKEQSIDWLTRNEAAKYFGVSLVTIYNWTKEGILTSYKISNRLRYKKSELENILLNSNKEASE
ncbi:helix-turn-helix domain-containing protein [Gramella lutea]|uniref:Helix-turn-helix domain-containing protein n=1 Tax=Christiangramia lutea TaxID=1607951 RepID=A0A9X1V2L0_9FLAO|nr:helix-turn-helix domain-containing protein [Christiangramia lutea]MCH4821759.1 helix-turn-helix domain-containing protein [Christiangramia lutea]